MMAVIPAPPSRHPWHLYAGFAAIPIGSAALMAMLLSKPVPLSVLAEQTPCVAAVLADQLRASPDRSPVTEWDRRGAVGQCERATAAAMTHEPGSNDQGAWSLWEKAILANGGIPNVLAGMVIGFIACALGYALVATKASAHGMGG